LPQERERFRGAELVDANSILSTRITPTVRLPAARLASGALVLGLADAVVLNGPNIGQASNNAAKCAEIYLESIVEQGDRSFDEVWMHQTFERYWRAYARWVVSWTATLLRPPPPHVIRIVDEAERLPGLARQIVNGFDDPRRFHPWWFDPAAAATLIAEKRAEASVGLDRRELRRALGQFATGVTVVTAWDGVRDLPVGLTINSFTSLSLDPPLVLFCPQKSSTTWPRIQAAKEFCVNVLAEDQEALCRAFAASGADKYRGRAALPFAAVRDVRRGEVRGRGLFAGRRPADPGRRVGVLRLPERPADRRGRSRDHHRRDRAVRECGRGAARLPFGRLPRGDAPPGARPLIRSRRIAAAGDPTFTALGRS
jgi:hypothetical protein